MWEPTSGELIVWFIVFLIIYGIGTWIDGMDN